MAAFADFEVFDRAGGGLRAGGLTYGDVDVFRAWEDVEEPADESRDANEDADDSDGEAGDKARDAQGEAEGGDDRPAGGLGDFDFSWIFRFGVHGVARTLMM